MRTNVRGIAALGAAALGLLVVSAPATLAAEPAKPAEQAKPTLSVVKSARPLSRSEKSVVDGKVCDAMIGRYAGYISNSRGTWNLYICESGGTRESIWVPMLNY